MEQADLKAAHARSVVKSVRVRVPEETSIIVGRPQPQGAIKPEAKHEMIRENGVVRGVEVICSCGERHRFRFEYE